MKFYNPFKAHIVKNYNGRFYIRKLGLTGWKRVGDEGLYWHLLSNAQAFFSEEKAKEFMEYLKNRNKEEVL